MKYSLIGRNSIYFLHFIFFSFLIFHKKMHKEIFHTRYIWWYTHTTHTRSRQKDLFPLFCFFFPRFFFSFFSNHQFMVGAARKMKNLLCVLFFPQLVVVFLTCVRFYCLSIFFCRSFIFLYCCLLLTSISWVLDFYISSIQWCLSFLWYFN